MKYSRYNLLHNLKIKKVRYFSRLRVFLYCILNSDANVIINDCTPSNISWGYNDCIDFEYVLGLFGPLLIGDQNVITVRNKEHQYSSYKHIIIYTLRIDKFKEYRLEYHVNKHDEFYNHYKLSINYFKFGFEHHIYSGHYEYPFGLDQNKTQRVLDNNYLLGFEPPVDIKLPEPLCMTCHYFTGNNYLRCSVNPSELTRTCFECRDYVHNPDKKFSIEDYK
jgi:hypothetical protein